MDIYKAIKGDERVYVNPDKMEEFIALGFKIYKETNEGDILIESIPSEKIVSVKI